MRASVLEEHRTGSFLEHCFSCVPASAAAPVSEPASLAGYDQHVLKRRVLTRHIGAVTPANCACAICTV